MSYSNPTELIPSHIANTNLRFAVGKQYKSNKTKKHHANASLRVTESYQYRNKANRMTRAPKSIQLILIGTDGCQFAIYVD